MGRFYKPAYYSWASMKRRCNSPKEARYHRYGGRGITYDPRWEFYAEFWKDMGPTWKKGLSIDRIDNDGNYTKSNCRWATNKEQCNNMAKNKKYTYGGKTLNITEWAKVLKISPQTLWTRLITEKWSVARALGNGNEKHRKKIYDKDIARIFELRKQGKGQREIGKELGVSQTVISKILNFQYKYAKRYRKQGRK